MGRASRRKRERRDEPRRARVERHEDGSRTIYFGDSPEEKELVELLETQRQRFREKFGRDPGPDDPLMFDPDADDPQPISELKIEADVVAAMEQVGMPPAYIYAYQQTGLLLTEQNMHLLSDEDIAGWEEALDRYERLHEAD